MENHKVFVREDDFELITEHDEYPDLSWLKTEYDYSAQKIINSSRYCNDTVKKYGWETVYKWIKEDHRRLNSYGEAWYMVGVGASVDVYCLHCGYKKFEHFVCWGVESDSSDDYFNDFFEEAKEELKREIEEYYGHRNITFLGN